MIDRDGIVTCRHYFSDRLVCRYDEDFGMLGMFVHGAFFRLSGRDIQDGSFRDILMDVLGGW